MFKGLSAGEASSAIACQEVFFAANARVAVMLTLLQVRWRTWRRMLMKAEGLEGI